MHGLENGESRRIRKLAYLTTKIAKLITQSILLRKGLNGVGGNHVVIHECCLLSCSSTNLKNGLRCAADGPLYKTVKNACSIHLGFCGAYRDIFTAVLKRGPSAAHHYQLTATLLITLAAQC